MGKITPPLARGASKGYLYGSTVSVVYEEQFYDSFMDAVNKGQIKIIQECQ